MATVPPGESEVTGADDSLRSGNIADLVTLAARQDPAHLALIEPAGASTLEITWADLDAAVTREAGRLRAAGAGAGDRVALRLPTGAAFCVALFGILRAGCVVVPLAPSSPAAETSRILADSGARLLITDDAEQPLELAGSITVLAPPEAGSGDVTEPIIPPARGEDLAVLAYTSGTTAASRAAMLSHRALLSNVEQCAQLRPRQVNAADRVLVALPLFHAYGLGPCLLQVAFAGATAVLLPRFEAEAALDVIAKYRVTTVVGVPPMYQQWRKLPASRLREAMTTVRLLTSGAAPLSGQAAVAIAEATGIEVFEGYGLTETGPVLTTTLAGGHPKLGSVGRAIPGVEVRLVDSDGDPLLDAVDDGDTGHVSARGPNLFSGYWPDGAHGPDEQGWFRTGDVGYFDADGDLHLVDRDADLIIVNGFNVYPHEVEQAVLGMDGVVEAAVIGVPHEVSGETVKAVVVAREGCEVTEAAVIAHCAANLAKFKVPARVEFASQLPHSPTGKLARRMLRE